VESLLHPYRNHRHRLAHRSRFELSVPSKIDIDRARAFAGLPPDTGDASFEEFTAPVPNSNNVPAR
jgi:hypothetical protein